MLELGIKIDEWYLLNVFSPFRFTLVCFTFTFGLTPELSVWTVESHTKRVEHVQWVTCRESSFMAPWPLLSAAVSLYDLMTIIKSLRTRSHFLLKNPFSAVPFHSELLRHFRENGANGPKLNGVCATFDRLSKVPYFLLLFDCHVVRFSVEL